MSGLSAQAAPPKIVIAVEDDWAPYAAAVASGGKPGSKVEAEGFAVDLVRAVFASKGVQVEFLTVPFARCMLYAKDGRAVGCFNATITDDNRADYHWHEPSMFEEELSIFARSESTRDKLSLKDLKGQRVGYTLGYTYPSEFMHDNSITKYSATSDQLLLKMLVSGRVDFILLNRTPGYLRISTQPEFQGKAKHVGVISLDAFWIAFSKKHPEGKPMAELFGQGLADMKRNGSYQRMLQDFRQRVGYR